uniref:RRM domain-containing protein n=1 Tax=Eutreptiella gymnastica TaxID=73025 RepID=A0A7S4G6M8_9EUGL
MENVVTPEVTIEPVHTPKVPDDTTEKVPDDTTEKVPTTEKMPNDTTEAYLSDKVKKSKKAKKKVKKKVVRVDLGALHKDFDDEEFEEFGDQFVEDEFKVPPDMTLPSRRQTAKAKAKAKAKVTDTAEPTPEVTLDDVMALLVELRDDVRLLLQQDRHPGPRDIRDGGRFEEPPLHRPWEKETPHRHKKHRAWFEDEEDGYEEDGRRPQGRRAWGDRDDDYRRPPRPSRREDREGARGGRRRDAGRHRDAEERWDEEEYQGDRLERDRAPPRGRGYGEAEPPSPPRGGRSQAQAPDLDGDSDQRVLVKFQKPGYVAARSEVQDIFNKFGRVVNTETRGRLAVITFASPKDATAAIENADGAVVNGIKLKCTRFFQSG